MNTKRNAMSVDIFGTTVTVTFSNGKDLAIDVAALTPELQRLAMCHGIKQKLVDTGAIARNTDTGLSASVDDKYAAVAEVHARLTGPNPTWNKARSADDKPVKQKDLLVRALMQMTGRDKDYVDAFLTAKTKEEREALKKNPRVLAIIVELQASSGTNGVDTDALLGELGAEFHDAARGTDAEAEMELASREDDSEDDTSALSFENPPKTIAQQVQEAIQKPKRIRKAAVSLDSII